MTSVALFSDGSSVKADGSGKVDCAYAFVFVADGEPRFAFAKYVQESSIMRAELQGVVQGLIFAHTMGKEPIDVMSVTSDSSAITSYVAANRKRYDSKDWKISTGKPAANIDLWSQLIEEERRQENPPEYIHVAGHSNVDNNELCDRLAVEARLNKTTVCLFMDRVWCEEHLRVHELDYPVKDYVEPENIPYPVLTDEPVCVDDPITRELSMYTDNRAASCLVTYPDMEVEASLYRVLWRTKEGSSSMHAPVDSCGVRPILSPDKKEPLPIKKLRTESGTPMVLNGLIDGDRYILELGTSFTELVKKAAKKASKHGKGLALVFQKLRISVCIGASLAELEWVGDYATKRAKPQKVCFVPPQVCELLKDMDSICLKEAVGENPQYIYNIIGYAKGGKEGIYAVSSVPVTNVVIDGVAQYAIMSGGMLGNVRTVKDKAATPDMWKVDDSSSSSVGDTAAVVIPKVASPEPPPIVKEPVPDNALLFLKDIFKMLESEKEEKRFLILCDILNAVVEEQRSVQISMRESIRRQVKDTIIKHLTTV